MKNKTYHAIADLVGIPSERQWFIEDPKKYFKDNLDEDDDITVWVEAVNKDWESAGYVLACFDIDSDSYEMFVCKKDVFDLLAEEAQKAGHRIDLAQNM